jgi:PadR family transcriptional regulator PadR
MSEHQGNECHGIPCFGHRRSFGHHGMHRHHAEDECGGRTRSHPDPMSCESVMFGRGLSSAPRRFLVPGLLVLLAESPSYGYALLNSLVDMQVIDAETPIGIVYRSLRHMEMEGLATSDQVEGEGRGPARKVYRLTDAGLEALVLWSRKLKSMGSIIEHLQKRYAGLQRGKKPEPEAKVTPE